MSRDINNISSSIRTGWKVSHSLVAFCFALYMPRPPRRVEPWSKARGKCLFRPSAKQRMVDMIASRGCISLSEKYVFTNGYVKDDSIIDWMANHRIFCDKDELVVYLQIPLPWRWWCAFVPLQNCLVQQKLPMIALQWLVEYYLIGFWVHIHLSADDM